MADTRSLLVANKFPLLRRLSITSLVAMLITAAILIFLYRQDQLSEHEEDTAQDNEKTAVYLMRLLDDQINTLVTTSDGFDVQALRMSPNTDLAALEMVREYNILKLKIYNLSGTTLYSSAKGEIGETSRHPDLLAKALRGEVVHRIEFRDTFLGPTGEMHDIYVALIYMPLAHAGKRIGVFEVYADATPIFKRIQAKTIQIALIVFCAFTALYAALFFYVRRTDRAVAEWQRRVAKSETRYHSLFENMLDGFAYCRMQYDDHGRPVDFVYLNVNEAFGRLTGLKEVVGKPVSEVIPGIREQHPELFEIYGRVAATGIPEIFDIDLKLLGKWFTISVYSPEPGEGYFIAIFDDITERKQNEELLRESEQQFRQLSENIREVFWMTDPAKNKMLYISPAYEQVWGRTLQSLYDSPRAWLEAIHDEDRQHVLQAALTRQAAGLYDEEYRIVRPNGDVRWIHDRASPVRDSGGAVYRIAGIAEDITEHKQAEEEIRNLAFHDTLTQLPNRRLLNDRLGQTLAASKRSGRYGALMFMDLDNFKPLNDTHGHCVGDLLLIEVARRITGCVRETDTVARFGGDEFVVILSELDVDKTESLAQADIVAEKIRAILAEPYVLTIQQEGKAEITVEHHCTSSIGIVLFISYESSAEDILKWADMAMYQAKEAGRNLIRFYEPKV